MWGGWEPSKVKCRRDGLDDRGQDEWMCEAYTSVRLHDVNVTCEGFNHDEDDFILPGSCGLQYSLEFWNEVFQVFGVIHIVVVGVNSFLHMMR